MNHLHFKYVIIGSGGAGAAAALAIRQRDSSGSILMLGQESSRPYLRPTLSKSFLTRDQNRSEISIDPVGWYAQHKIEMRTGRRATHLDTPRRSVTLDNGQSISYEKLLIATGAGPKPLQVPGTELPNVFYLRNLSDADRLHHALDVAKANGRPHGSGRGRVVVIGGGLLGVEVSAALQGRGFAIDLITARSHFWVKIAGETVGRLIARTLSEHGVTTHIGTPPTRLEGDGRVQRVVLDDRKIDCDLTIIAVGVMPSRELLRSTPIRAENAILTDDHCRTSVPEIYAAGDCAALLDPLFGKHRQLDHWDSARALGALAGANMAGADDAYWGVNHFSSRIFDLELHVWGEPRLVHHRFVRGGGDSVAEIGVDADGRVTQVLAVNRPTEHAAFERLVAERRQTSDQIEQLKDPSHRLDLES